MVACPHHDCSAALGGIDYFYPVLGGCPFYLHPVLVFRSGRLRGRKENTTQVNNYRGWLVPQYAFKNQGKRFLIAALDRIGSLIVSPFRFFQHPVDVHKIRRILIIRLDSLGDLLMTRPAIHALRKRFPQAQIELLMSEKWAPLFHQTSEVDKVIAWEAAWHEGRRSFPWMIRSLFRLAQKLRRQKFDLAIDFRGDMRHILLMALAGIPHRYGYGITGGGFLLTHQGRYAFDRHQVFVNLGLLEGLGIDEEPIQIPLAVSRESYRKFWDKEIVRSIGVDRPRIIIHPGAAYPSKRWPVKKYAEIITALLKDRLGIMVLIGTQNEKNEMNQLVFNDPGVLDLRGMTALEELPALFEACDLYLGNDSGPAHLAATQGLEVISVFSGTNDYRAWHPWTKSLSLIRYNVPCSPCEARQCPLIHHDCMEKISVPEVISKVKEVLIRKGQLRV